MIVVSIIISIDEIIVLQINIVIRLIKIVVETIARINFDKFVALQIVEIIVIMINT